MSRVIVGGPKTGKTTMAPEAKHTDDLIPLGWQDAKRAVTQWIDAGHDVEGVQAARGLRQWLRDNPEGKPCDEVVWLSTPKEARTQGQANMGKAVDTVMREIAPELARRGVAVKREGA